MKNQKRKDPADYHPNLDGPAEPIGLEMKNPAAVALGRLGGKANTVAQNKARARNAKLGGWPKGRPRKSGPSQGMADGLNVDCGASGMGS